MSLTKPHATPVGFPTVPLAGKPYQVTGCSVRTCKAADGCPRSVGDVPAAAQLVSQALSSMDVAALMAGKAQGPVRAHHRVTAAISGCPNQCSQPQIADFGLVGLRYPRVDHEYCSACGLCVQACSEGALLLSEAGLVIDGAACVGCGSCIARCPSGGLKTREEGWGVLVGGRLGRHPRLATRVASCVPLSDAVDRLSSMMQIYLRHGRIGERIGAALDRIADVELAGAGPLAELERRRAAEVASVLEGRTAGSPRGGG